MPAEKPRDADGGFQTGPPRFAPCSRRSDAFQIKNPNDFAREVMAMLV